MTPDELKQAADEMVGVFGPYMAIAHCKRVINEITWWHDTTSYETTMDFEGAERRINHYRLILSELEGRVK
jgi:hypothetical protein